MTGLNDTVAAAASDGTYNTGKDATLAGRTQDGFMAGKSQSFNKELLDAGGLPSALQPSAGTGPVLFMDSRYSSAGEQVAFNRGVGDVTGKSGLIVYDDALRHQGVANNQLAVVNDSEFGVANDFSIVVRVRPDSWSPSGDAMSLIGTWAGTGNWYIRIKQGGGFEFFASDGVTYNANTTSAPTLAADGEWCWIGMSLQLDTGGSTSRWQVWESLDGQSWTSITDQTPRVFTAQSQTTDPLHLLSYSSSTDDPFYGAMSYAAFYTGVGANTAPAQGTLVFEHNFANSGNWAGPSLTADSGQAMTLETTATDFGAPSGLDATYGSVRGAYVYDNYLSLPGLSGNEVEVDPGNDAYTITGDIEMVCRIRPDTWNNGTHQAIMGKFGTSTATRAPGLVTSSDKFSLWWSDGVSTYYQSCLTTHTAAGFLDGETYWVKVTRDASTWVVQFFYAEDQVSEPSSWTYLNDASTTTAGASVDAGTEPFRVGTHYGTTNPFAGRVYRTIVRDGIGGTTALDINFALDVADWEDTSFTATTGETVTINSTGADTNDPLLLTHTGRNYVRKPEDAGNSVRTDSVVDIPSNTDVFGGEWWGLINDSASTSYIGYSVTSGGGGTGHGLLYLSTGSFRVDVRVGANTRQASFSYPSGVVDGDELRVRYVVDMTDFIAADVYMWVSKNGGDWEYLGVTLMAPFTGPYVQSTATTFLSGISIASGDNSVYGFKLMISPSMTDPADDGTIHFQMVPSDITGSASFTATTGETVNVVRATAGRKTTVVTRPVWLCGTDDYLEVADNALLNFPTGDMAAMVVTRRFDTLSNQYPFSKYSGSLGPGYSLRTSGSTYRIVTGDGVATAQVGVGAEVAGELETIVGSYDGTADQLYIDVQGIEGDSTAGGNAVFSTTDPLTVGGHPADSPTSIPYHGEVMAFAVWDRRLTATEIDEINTFYGTE